MTDDLDILPETWVPGTPRGYGDAKIENEWLNCVRRAIGVRGHPIDPDPRCEVTLRFLVDANSPRYRGQAKPHGPDLDNLVKVVMDGLTDHKGRGVNILPNDNCVYRIVASKDLVDGDDQTGVWIKVSALP